MERSRYADLGQCTRLQRPRTAGQRRHLVSVSRAPWCSLGVNFDRKFSRETLRSDRSLRTPCVEMALRSAAARRGTELDSGHRYVAHTSDIWAVLADIWPICLDTGSIGRYSGRYMADKHSIAQLLSQHAERWNSPAEIKTEIADVPDRTLRRWLGELMHEGVIERSGSRKGTRYRWKPTAKDEQRLPVVAGDSESGPPPTHIPPRLLPQDEQPPERTEATPSIQPP